MSPDGRSGCVGSERREGLGRSWDRQTWMGASTKHWHWKVKNVAEWQLWGMVWVCWRCWTILSSKRKEGWQLIFFYTHLQYWTKVLGTVLQYSYVSVILFSQFPLKTVHPFRNFLVDLPPPTLYKVETRKKCWKHASNIVCGVRGGGGVDLCELENVPEM